jgi:hypothetical protein
MNIDIFKNFLKENGVYYSPPRLFNTTLHQPYIHIKITYANGVWSKPYPKFCPIKLLLVIH